MGRHSAPTLTPRIRLAAYVTVALLAAVWAIAYVVLATVAPDMAERLLRAPGALVAVLPALVGGLAAAMAAVHTDTSTQSGAPSAEVAPQ